MSVQQMAECSHQLQYGYGTMFFRKKPPEAPRTQLVDLVPRAHETGYIFVDVNNDLGAAAEAIMKSEPALQMAYGYARRSAASAMYAQGLVGRDVYEHAQMIFRALQLQTGQTTEFQEQAFDEALSFMKTYHWQLTRITLTAISNLANNYDRAEEGQLADADLIRQAIEVMHVEQQERHSSK